MRAPTRRCRSRLLAWLVVGSMMLLLPPQVARAHAVLIRADPAPNGRLRTAPVQVDLLFSEALNHSFSTVQVVDSASARRDTGAVQFTTEPTELLVALSTLAPGFYTVRWTTLSAVDGHRWQGTYPFVVLTADGSLPAGATTAPSADTTTGLSPFDVGLHWLLLLGLVGMAGGFGFAALVLYPAAGTLANRYRPEGRRVALQLLGTIVPPAAAVVVIANLAALVRGAVLAGSLRALPQLLAGLAGVSWVGRELGAVWVAILAWWLASPRTRSTERLAPLLLGGGVLLSLTALLTMSLTAHAAGGAGAVWAVPSDFLHLVGVALWLGGVLQLPVLLHLHPALDGLSWQQLQARVLHRFATLAVVSVTLVLVSGSFNAFIQIPSPTALVQTAYGQTLLIKLGLLVPLLSLALLNGAWIARRFEAAAAHHTTTGTPFAQRLVHLAILESVAGAIVVAVTAVLVSLVPATSLAAQSAAQAASTVVAPASPYQQQAAAGDLRMTLTISPNHPGENHITVQLTGLGTDHIQRVQLRIQAANQRGGSVVNAASVPDSVGAFAVDAANLSQSGQWQVTVNVRRSGFDDVDGSFRVRVPARIGSRSVIQFPAHGITVWQTWLVIVLTAAGLLVFLLWRAGMLRVAHPAVTVALVASTFGVVCAGAILLVRPTGKPSGWGRTSQVIPEQVGAVTSWAMPTPASGLMMPAVGPDGRVWVAEMTANKLAVLDPRTNTVTEVAYPGSQPVSTMGIAVDSQGRVWLAQSGAQAIGLFTPATGRYQAFPTPTAHSGPAGIALDGQGRVWFTELGGHRIGRYDPPTGSFAEYPIPTGRAAPYWLRVAPDGQVWFTDIRTGSIGRLDATTGRIDTFSVPGATGTTGIDVAADGSVWFGVAGGQLGHLIPGDADAVLRPLPHGDAYGVAVTRDGTVWVGTAETTVYRFTPQTQALQTLTVGAGAWWFATAGDAVWVSEGADESNRLARLALPPDTASAASAGTRQGYE